MWVRQSLGKIVAPLGHSFISFGRRVLSICSRRHDLDEKLQPFIGCGFPKGNYAIQDR